MEEIPYDVEIKYVKIRLLFVMLYNVARIFA